MVPASRGAGAIPAGATGRTDRLGQRAQSAPGAAQIAQPQGAAAPSLQRSVVSQRLRLLERLEAERSAGNPQVGGIVRHDLQEQTAVGPSLVELSGRVQVARAIT